MPHPTAVSSFSYEPSSQSDLVDAACYHASYLDSVLEKGRVLEIAMNLLTVGGPFLSRFRTPVWTSFSTY